MRRYLELLNRRRRWAPLVAMLLTAPALLGGVELDDLFHEALAADDGDLVLDAFRFVDSARAHLAPADLPWWTEPGMRLALFRPLAGVTHWVDWTLWPSAPWAMHLVSVLIYGALVALIALLYRRFDGDGRRAALATWIFALSQAHGMNVGWVSARNSLLGALFVVAALLAHRVERERGRVIPLVAPLLLALGLASNEGAVAAVAYLAAYVVVLDRSRAGWLSLTPYVALVLAWRLGASHAGFGIAHSGMYLDPPSAPLEYVGRTLVHGTLLLAARYGIAGVDGLGPVPGGYVLALIGALPFVLAMVALAWPRLREDPTLRAWALGSVLTLGTAGALVPTDRNLLMLGIGACFVLADLIDTGLRATSRGRRSAALVLVGLHLGLSVLLLPLRTLSSGFVQRLVDPIADAMPREPSVAERSVIMLQFPSDLVAMYTRAMHTRGVREGNGQPAPARITYLYAGPGVLTVDRVADDVLRLESTRPWLEAPLDRMYRHDVAFTPGDRIAGDCFDAIVEEVEVGLPRVVRFELHARGARCQPVFMIWRDGAPRPFELPPVGRRVELPSAAP